MKGRLWGLVLIVVGAGAWFGADSIWKNYADDERAARSEWPTVQGTVLASSVAWEGDDPPYSPSLTVSFEYQTDGERYSAEQKWYVQESFGDRLGRQAPRTEEVKRSYSPGKTATVYYDPTNHANAQVVPKADGSWLFLPVYLALALGFLAVFFGILLLLAGT